MGEGGRGRAEDGEDSAVYRKSSAVLLVPSPALNSAFPPAMPNTEKGPGEGAEEVGGRKNSTSS